MNKQFINGYFKIILTFGLLIMGLLNFPSMNIQSLEGVFSTLWFGIGALIVIANFIYISKIEKTKARINQTRIKQIRKAQTRYR